jgi:hypothetical protein
MTGPAKYRKKPVANLAMQWTGENYDDLHEWGAQVIAPKLSLTNYLRLYVDANFAFLDVRVGEWIIKDASGFYPCNADRFAETYEPAE